MTNISFKPKIPETFSSTNIENVCRTCLQNEATLLPIFKNKIDEMISEFLPDKIDSQDNFPQQICTKCLTDVKIAYTFKKQVEYSNDILKKILDEKTLNNNLIKHKKIFNNPINDKLECHICKEMFHRKNILKQHLEEKHKFYKFEEFYGNLFSKYEKFSDENYVEEILFPIHPQVLIVNDENDIKIGKSNVHNENLLEEKDELCGPQNQYFIDDKQKNKLNPSIYQKRSTYDCNVCRKHLTTRSSLKCHLERIHKIYDANTTKIKNISKEKGSVNEQTFKSKSSKTESSPHLHKEDNDNDGNNIHLFVCRICNDTFAIRSKLQEHYEKIHNIFDNDRPIDLSYESLGIQNNNNVSVKDIISSDNQSDNQNIINLNINQTKSVNVYICHICDKKFSGRTTVRRHLKNVHKYKNFDDTIWLSKVYRKNIEVKSYECDKCHKIFTRLSDLTRHKLLHSDDPRAKPYACTMCSKTFSRSNHLKNHLNGPHADIRPFKCLICEKSFTRNEHLKRHALICPIERKRFRKEKNFSCEICMRKFSSEKCVQDHIAVQHNETKEFSCKHCAEKIIGATEFKKHCKDRHNTDSKQFLCSECGGSFTKLQDLKIHIRRHTGEKPYKCRYCEKAFPRAADQYAHERSHTGEKNFHCTSCPKAFSTAYKLRVHMRIHTGERPYKCSYCLKAFGKNNDLKAHHRRHTGERFYCNLCDVGFVQMYILKQHKRQVHGINEPRRKITLLDKAKILSEKSPSVLNTIENKTSNNTASVQAENSKQNTNMKNESIGCEPDFQDKLTELNLFV